jgi:hypothetical protein
MADGAKYVLQVAEYVDMEVPLERTPEGAQPEPQEPTFETRQVWRDVATVTVPARTKSRTVIRHAVEQAGIKVEGMVEVRLLPASVAEPIELLPPEPMPGPRQVRL